MPEYAVNIKTDACLSVKDLETLEDVVYDVVTTNMGGSIEVDDEEIGITDVEAVYN